MKGKIITIEGLDGAGKSTQIALLTERLQKLGVPHKFIHFPMLGQGVYGELIAEFLRGEYGSLEKVHPKLVALLFAEDRNEHQHKINQWIKEGNLVILDRYVKSNIAFQCAKIEDKSEKNILKEWIFDFEFGHNNLPQPSASFYLHVPLHYIEKSLRNARKGADRAYLKGKSDIHEDSIDLQRKVHKEYQKLLHERENFHEIRCFSEEDEWLRPEEIHQAIMKRIQID